MTATEFKNGIKEIKESLRGLTLQLVHSNGYRPYHSLKEFGYAILNEETKGNDFRVNQVWTKSGVLGVKSIQHLAELVSTGNVTAVQFESYYNYSTQEEYIRSFGALD